jgi:hypothetical protein
MPLSETELLAIRDSASKSNERIAALEARIEGLVDQAKTFITRVEFGPVKLITYGLVVSVLGSSITSLMGKVLVR